MKSILFIDELNNHRLQLRETLDRQEEISPGQLTDVLLRMQLLMYQNRDSIDVAADLETNTRNLLRLINWEHRVGAASNVDETEKFEVNFEAEWDEGMGYGERGGKNRCGAGDNWAHEKV